MRIFLLLISLGLLTICKVQSVVEDTHDPVVAIMCGKVGKYKDLVTKQWKDDPDRKSLCDRDEKNEILQFCKKSYPNEDVQNIVENNNEEVVKNWCDVETGDCTSEKSVITYRCLVGEFEADGLMVPTACHFLHLHDAQKCQGHDEWKEEAELKCKSEQMVMGQYGMLLPCNIDKFEGVEFVCCNKTKDTVVEKVVNTVEEEEEDTLESLMDTLLSYVKPVENSQAIECDRLQFHDRREKMEEKHRQRVSDAVQEWEETDQRYNILKKDDPDQAGGMITDAMDRFKKTITALEEQATLERQHLREEQHECTQIDINIKKRQSLKQFLEAINNVPRDPKAIIDAVKKFVRLSQHDRFHNLRFFEHVRKDDAKKAEDMRQTLTNHLKVINERMNQTMNLLYKVPEIASRYRFILPDWAPKPAIPQNPTDAPTAAENKDVVREDLSPASEVVSPTNKPVPTDPPVLEDDSWMIYTTHRPPVTKDDEDENEDEHAGEKHGKKWRGHKSPTTFAAIVGLCCGALIVMIVIIVAMVVRKGRSPVTKTVLVDPECSADEEKRHLMNMQRSGYENPTYKFYDY